ncbi:uncharacterized protein LOC108251864 [Diaphorina citri]|uniref:Uncharacterized protein LOC108251864 n=1 Tax=Diaphorina citri TaxID=121845 RepID=A0A1S4E6G0_DIACI|nr:uncharacterized protein LOC108251864 [Diaphorina citri]
MASPDTNEDATSNANESEDPDKDDCLLDHMEISIPEAEKRTNPSLNIREFYTVYLIETKVTDEDWSLIPKQNKLSIRITKEEDLRASLRNYVGLQIRMNRKCLSTWTNIKACIESIP